MTCGRLFIVYDVRLLETVVENTNPAFCLDLEDAIIFLTKLMQLTENILGIQMPEIAKDATTHL